MRLFSINSSVFCGDVHHNPQMSYKKLTDKKKFYVGKYYLEFKIYTSGKVFVFEQYIGNKRPEVFWSQTCMSAIVTDHAGKGSDVISKWKLKCIHGDCQVTLS